MTPQIIAKRRRVDRPATWLRLATVPLGLCLAAMIGACDGGDADNESPPPTPTPARQSDGSPDASREEAALAAYRGMWQAYAKAGRTADPNEPELVRFAGGDALATLKKGLSSYRSKGQILKGRYSSEPRIAQKSLTSSPLSVTVTDCVDDTHFLVYTASGKPINDVPGGRRATRATVTDLGAQGWKVATFAVQGVGTC
ncbi:hypothetical protein [Micromonospora sp. WMMD980]|uniref:hypothetical protein n=1 Tax=Micromonospora sp. WMMD980 TaxID=3016088 RepID=UPI0024178259|nr:hypothetical protein [Micromonospora sp. WMMD980]MDG4803618.1 hypothetical protein [Micromonospora sp. WMMD980]